MTVIKKIPKPSEPCERETIIQYDNASDTAVVYTWNPSVNTYLNKQGVKPVEAYTNDRRRVAWLYHVPKSWVKIRRPKQMPPRDPDKMPTPPGRRKKVTT